MQGNKGKKPTASEISQAFDGAVHLQESNLRQTAVTTIRISRKWIQTNVEIIDYDHADLLGS